MNGITFERKDGKLVITVDLKTALAGTLSTGRAGSHGDARGDFNGKPFRVNLNVMQAGKLAPVAQV
jgi:hypothetical protein